MSDANLTRKAPNILQHPCDLRLFPAKSNRQFPSLRSGNQPPERNGLVLACYACYAPARRLGSADINGEWLFATCGPRPRADEPMVKLHQELTLALHSEVAHS